MLEQRAAKSAGFKNDRGSPGPDRPDEAAVPAHRARDVDEAAGRREAAGSLRTLGVDIAPPGQRHRMAEPLKTSFCPQH